MEYRITLCAMALMSCLFLPAATAAAQTLDASVSGPANGTNVMPSAGRSETERRTFGL